MPETIEGEVSSLDVGDALHVGEITWPDGVRPTLGDDVVVALVAKTRVAMSEEADGEEGAEAVVDAPVEESSE